MNIALANDFRITSYAGFEEDVYQNTDKLSMAGLAGLNSITLTRDKTKIRGVAGLGFGLNVSKYQVIKGFFDYRELPYQSKGAVTGMLTYELGL